MQGFFIQKLFFRQCFPHCYSVIRITGGYVAKKRSGLAITLKAGQKKILKEGVEITNEGSSNIKIRVFNPSVNNPKPDSDPKDGG